METVKQWNNMFKVLEQEVGQPRILYLADKYLKNQDKIVIFR